MAKMIFYTGAAVCALLTLTGTVQANDWPQWRGMQRDGVSTETGLLKAWPADGPPVAWKSKGLGLGYSGVAVAGGRIYTVGDLKDGCYAFALDEKDGKQIWSTMLGEGGAPGWGGFAGPRCTPTVDGDKLFVAGQFGEIACLAASDGKLLWKKHAVNDFGGARPEWGFSESPLADNDVVLYTPGGAKGAIVALKKDTGELAWRTKDFTDNAHYSSIIVATIGGVRQYVQLTDASLVGFLPGGEILWKAPRKGQTAVITTPVCKDDMVFVTSGYGVGCNMFKVTKDNGAFRAEQVYANKDLENHHGGVVLLGDYVYGH